MEKYLSFKYYDNYSYHSLKRISYLTGFESVTYGINCPTCTVLFWDLSMGKLEENCARKWAGQKAVRL